MLQDSLTTRDFMVLSLVEPSKSVYFSGDCCVVCLCFGQRRSPTEISLFIVPQLEVCLKTPSWGDSVRLPETAKKKAMKSQVPCSHHHLNQDAAFNN